MSQTQTVLITGANGQLGYELQASQPAHVRLVATDASTLDITQPAQIAAALAQYRPDCIINSAAYTAVDKAETDQDTAYRINAMAPALLAQACAASNAQGHPLKLVQISTDFVFDGKQSSPYLSDAPAENPLGVYGASKLAGEQAVLEHLPQQALIIRTSWLYSAHGNNFVKSMLRLMQEKEQLGIVFDQVGSPTWAATLARTIWSMLAKDSCGIYHCSDNGVASWYDFAAAIQEEAVALGMLSKTIPLKPIRSSQYPTPAQRPAYSVMDKASTEAVLQETLPHWRTSLRAMLRQLQHQTTTV